jgi:hypothetical protein
VRTGHHAATWTFDPMRGANARLNVEKLGGVCRTLTVDKYGPLRSALYGDVPSDRLVATWDLLDPAVATRLAAVHDGSRAVLSAADLAAIPEAARKLGTGRDSAATLRYEIPADIDRLTRDDPAAAARWRGEMRRVLGALLATERAVPGPGGDPLRTAVERTPGAFVVDGFASVLEGGGERRNHYLLSRRPIEEALDEARPRRRPPGRPQPADVVHHLLWHRHAAAPVPSSSWRRPTVGGASARCRRCPSPPTRRRWTPRRC